LGGAVNLAAATLEEPRNSYLIPEKVINKTSNLVSTSVITELTPLAPELKTMMFENGKEYVEHQPISASLILPRNLHIFFLGVRKRKGIKIQWHT
jgi:hypothetical protein